MKDNDQGAGRVQGLKAYRRIDEGNGDEPPEPDPNYPKPPTTWTLQSVGVFLCCLGGYILSKEGLPNDIKLFGIALCVLGLAMLVVSKYYGIAKRW